MKVFSLKFSFILVVVCLLLLFQSSHALLSSRTIRNGVRKSFQRAQSSLETNVQLASTSSNEEGNLLGEQIKELKEGINDLQAELYEQLYGKKVVWERSKSSSEEGAEAEPAKPVEVVESAPIAATEVVETETAPVQPVAPATPKPAPVAVATLKTAEEQVPSKAAPAKPAPKKAPIPVENMAVKVEPVLFGDDKDTLAESAVAVKDVEVTPKMEEGVDVRKVLKAQQAVTKTFLSFATNTLEEEEVVAEPVVEAEPMVEAVKPVEVEAKPAAAPKLEAKSADGWVENVFGFLKSDPNIMLSQAPKPTAAPTIAKALFSPTPAVKEPKVVVTKEEVAESPPKVAVSSINEEEDVVKKLSATFRSFLGEEEAAPVTPAAPVVVAPVVKTQPEVVESKTAVAVPAFPNFFGGLLGAKEAEVAAPKPVVAVQKEEEEVTVAMAKKAPSAPIVLAKPTVSKKLETPGSLFSFLGQPTAVAEKRTPTVKAVESTALETKIVKSAPSTPPAVVPVATKKAAEPTKPNSLLSLFESKPAAKEVPPAAVAKPATLKPEVVVAAKSSALNEKETEAKAPFDWFAAPKSLSFTPSSKSAQPAVTTAKAAIVAAPVAKAAPKAAPAPAPAKPVTSPFAGFSFSTPAKPTTPVKAAAPVTAAPVAPVTKPAPTVNLFGAFLSQPAAAPSKPVVVAKAAPVVAKATQAESKSSSGNNLFGSFLSSAKPVPSEVKPVVEEPKAAPAPVKKAPAASMSFFGLGSSAPAPKQVVEAKTAKSPSAMNPAFLKLVAQTLKNDSKKQTTFQKSTDSFRAGEVDSNSYISALEVLFGTDNLEQIVTPLIKELPEKDLSTKLQAALQKYLQSKAKSSKPSGPVLPFGLGKPAATPSRSEPASLKVPGKIPIAKKKVVEEKMKDVASGKLKTKDLFDYLVKDLGQTRVKALTDEMVSALPSPKGSEFAKLVDTLK